MEIVGDFSLIIPYGIGSRVSRSSGSGLRVKSPDDHVMLLIPLYLIWGVFAVSFPSSSLPLLTIDLLPTLLLLQLKMTTPFAQYVDGMMGDHPILNQPLHLVGIYLKAYLASLIDRTLLEFDLRCH